jgi:hypothetical protein
MPPLSIANATVKELFRGSAKFGRPSTKNGAGWITTADKGNAIIQKQVSQDGTTVIVVRWTNYMGIDGLNGRILPELPILRGKNSKEVYFKTSSTTTRGARYKAPFVFMFETVEEAEEFEMWWLLKNGSIASWKESDEAKKKAGSNSNLPLQEKTNTVSTPISKRKAGPMIDGPLRKLKKVNDADRLLNLVLATGGGGGHSNNDVENQPAFLLDGNADDAADDDSISDPHYVGAFKAVGLMPTEVNIKGKLRAIVKVKRLALKSITEDSIDNSNEEDQIDLNDDNNDSNDDDNDDSSNGSSGEEVFIDEEDAPQSQNWTTAFASS